MQINQFSNEQTGSNLKEIFNLNEFKDNNTSNNNKLYGVLLSDDASTSLPAWEYHMIDEFKEILRNCSTEETEDESSPFITAAKKFLEKYGSEGFSLIRTYIINLAASYNVSLIADLMELIGDVHSVSSYNERYLFLKDNLKSNSPEIRYGVVLGLGNIGSPAIIPSLEESIRGEEYELISNAIQAVLNLLRK